MTPDVLLLALRDRGIVIEPDGDAIRWRGPKDAMTTPLAAALKAHKALLLSVFATLDDRGRDGDWDVIREWMLDTTKVFTKPMLAAATRVFPVGADEWPESYCRRFRAALRVRGLLRAFDHTMVTPITPSVLKGAR